MKQYKDRAIVLSRVEYGERDRILTLLCQQQGKISVLAKGVRSEKSRLAGGIELLSESEVSFVEGRSSIMALTSARLRQHFSELSKDIRRMQCAFAHLKVIYSIADEATGQDYYNTLLTSLASLNNNDYDLRIVDAWFNMRILHISGSEPNLQLEAVSGAEKFVFDYENQQFKASDGGLFSQNDLKVLRLCATQPKPPKLQAELGTEDRLQQLTQTLLRSNVTEL
jgi:DNA repair protein RecO (recombination protein O)